MKDFKKIIVIIFIAFFCLNESKAIIKDSLYVTVGNKAITQSDIIEEIKMILLLNGQSYSEENKEQLKSLAVKTVIKRKIKEIEIEKYKITQYNKGDLNNQLKKIAGSLNIELEILKKRFEDNNVDFSKVRDHIKVDLMWNSLIFQLYKHMMAINVNEIDEQLKIVSATNKINEYLISEIIVKYANGIEKEQQVKELNDKIKIMGFE